MITLVDDSLREAWYFLTLIISFLLAGRKFGYLMLLIIFLTMSVYNFQPFIETNLNVIESIIPLVVLLLIGFVMNLSETIKENNDINSFLQLVEGSIKNNNISVILDLNNDIKINGYENELTQCFINIFNNAKDVLVNTKDRNKLIFISTEIIKDNVIIKIKDNANGIDSKVISRIFEPYFTTKHTSQGTGLELHMIHKLIVDGMNGTIDAKNVHYQFEDKKYIGTEFTIILPLR